MTTKPTAYCYGEGHNAALIGPLFAHEVGDEVELPTRTHPFLHHEIPGDTWVVVRIDADGVAVGRRKALMEQAA